MTMDCTTSRESLSARADGEVLAVAEVDLDTHVHGCAPCTAFAADLDLVRRAVMVAAVDDVPDQTAEILGRIPSAPGRSSARFQQALRLVGLIGALQVVLALGLLIGGEATAHATREVGIFEVGLGVGFLVVAFRPARVAGLLPVAAVVALLATVTSVGDLFGGTSSTLTETTHLLEVIGTGLLWFVHRHQGSDRLTAVPTS